MGSGPVRVRSRDVLVAGATAAVGLALLVAAPALLADEGPAVTGDLPAPLAPAWWALAAALVAQAAALVVVRSLPRTTVAVVAALAAASAALLPPGLHGLGSLPVVVAVVVAVAGATSRAWPVLLAAAVAVAVGETAGGRPVLEGAVQAAALVGLPAVGGLVLRSRRDLRVARSREQEALVQAALARERTAMARELHDVAAHHLSGIALVAAVVDRQIDTDPAGAHEGARQIRAQSTSVLDDLRRLVGLLREDGAADRTVESVATIADLVGRSPHPVTLRTHPREGVALGSGVGPLAQLAAYRAVQEALSNAAVHAPGADCRVEVDDRDPARLRVQVRNSAPAAPAPRRTAGGFGLRGMRERADLVGATVRYGPTPDGGWCVEFSVERPAGPGGGA
ncbi:sensor histidine kinase [Kineococcus aurantiacus]|uniref:histidine kinase n=1 Tax=Kineococcus aurantiacus TaxID=37633 RepID=A0A7Y9J1Z7_9ACTN|nr:histidine kinase [Kineococcus aurantiacus]NYD23604.1 signal transduction histidine kinase [Kineococcus aurantiacus]